jgi:hypothetical protein
MAFENGKLELKRGMTPTHQMMGEWILENPGGTLREMGAFFGYSPAWLSQVINSDMFKAYMADRMKDIQGHVSMDIPARMRALAELACDRMQEVLMKTEDPDTVKDSFDKVMHRYGYAPNAKNGAQSATIQQQNNVFFLNQEDFKAAQDRMRQSHAPRTIQGEPSDPPALVEKV